MLIYNVYIFNIDQQYNRCYHYKYKEVLGLILRLSEVITNAN